MKKFVSVLLGLCLVGWGLSAPAPAQADDPGVTWPSQTRFNPRVTPYVFHVDYSGVDRLYASWGGAPMYPIAASGDVTAVFDRNAATTIKVYDCSSQGCSELAESPQLVVYRVPDLRVAFIRAVGPLVPMPVHITYGPSSAEEPMTLDWAVVAQPTASAPAIVSGSLQSPAHDVSVPLDDPSMTDGTYYVRVHAHGEFNDFGPLEVTKYRAFRYDRTPPETINIQQGGTKVYPKRDGYLDYHGVRVTFDEAVRPVAWDVLDRRGKVVQTLAVRNADAAVSQSTFWDGLVADEVVPGTYRLRLRATDIASMPVTVLFRPVEVRAERIRDLVWKKTFSAASTVIKAYVGKCSTLSRPSTHGWKGSLGYMSLNKCRDPRQGLAATLNGVYVPDLVLKQRGRFKSLTIGFYGGKGKGGTRPAEMQGIVHGPSGVISPYGPSYFGGGLGKHAMGVRAEDDGRFILRDRSGRPFVVWELGTANGVHYDVKTFTVTLRYRDLA